MESSVIDFDFGILPPLGPDMYHFTHGGSPIDLAASSLLPIRTKHERTQLERRPGDKRKILDTSLTSQNVFNWMDYINREGNSGTKHSDIRTSTELKPLEIVPGSQRLISSSEPSASQRALRLPEILAEVLRDFLVRDTSKAEIRPLWAWSELVSPDARSKRHSLFQFLQVSKLWFEEATTCLWSRNPPMKAFDELGTDLTRLQFYANKISRFDVPRHDEIFNSLKFPRLEKIFLYASTVDIKRPARGMSFLQPMLQTFISHESWLSDDYLRKISVSEHMQKDSEIGGIADRTQMLCPRLKMLKISTTRRNITPHGLLRFLNAMRSLVDFRMGSTTDALTSSVCLHLATRPGLRTLSLPHVILSDSIAYRISQLSLKMFPDLEHFTCQIKNVAFEALAPRLRNLKTLDLRLTDDLDVAVAAVSDCINLTSLTIKMQCRYPLDTPHALLMISRHCSHLRFFSIVNNSDGHRLGGVILMDFNQAEQFVMNLPKLEDFKYALDGSFSATRYLAALGTQCRNLKHISISGCVNLANLETFGARLFPELETFLFDGRRNVEPCKADKAAEILTYHAPKLLRAQNGGSTKWNDSLMDRIRDIQGSKKPVNVVMHSNRKNCEPCSKKVGACCIDHAHGKWKDVNPAFVS